MAVKKVESIIERITPARAEELLKHNGANRTLRDSRVQTYALHMQAGLWRADDNDSILISKDGEVLNGQHRLYAVIEAGVPVEMAIRYGVDKEMFKVLDQGLARTTADFMAPFTNSNKIVPCAKIMAAIKHGAKNFNRALNGKLDMDATVPNDWVIEEVNSNFFVYQDVARMGIRFKNQIRKGSLQGIMTAFMLVIYLDRDIRLYEFVDDFCAEQPCGAMARLLKNTLIQRNLRGLTTGKRELIGFILYAYEKYTDDEEVQRIQINLAIDMLDSYEKMCGEKYERKQGS